MDPVFFRMSADFPNIAILGGGLLGGSLALALGTSSGSPSVRLWARKKETVGIGPSPWHPGCHR